MARHSKKRVSEGPRRCVGCRQGETPERMLRFVVHERSLWIDTSRSLPGRGAWVHPRPGCLAQGIERGGFQRSLHAPVQDSVERVLDEGRRICQDEALRLLGLLRRSGVLIFGRDEVEKAVTAGRLQALCVSRDAAQRTAMAVQKLAKQASLALHQIGKREQFGSALGAAPVAVLGLPQGLAGRRADEALWRWAQLFDNAVVYKGTSGA